jgi:PadR family transcriptional regulator, regulatory protein PadR
MVPSEEGPARRYYGITERGRTQLAESRAVWQEFSQALGALLDTQVEASP